MAWVGMMGRPGIKFTCNKYCRIFWQGVRLYGINCLIPDGVLISRCLLLSDMQRMLVLIKIWKLKS